MRAECTLDFMEHIVVSWDGITLSSDAPRTLSRRHAQGELVRIRPGYYLEVDTWRRIPQWTRFGLVVMAVAAARPGVVFVGATAAFLHGIPLRFLPSDVEIQGAPRGHARRRPSTTDVIGDMRGRHEWGVHVVPGNHPSVEIAGVRAVSAETAVGTVAADPDITAAVATIDGFRRRRWLAGRDTPELPKGWLEGRSQAARRRIRVAWEQSDPLSESELETEFRLGAVKLGFQRPQLQVAIDGPGFEYRVDALWQEQGIICEVDGASKYGKTPEEQARARRDERIREENLKGLGYHVFRVTNMEIKSPGRLRAVLVGNRVPLASAAQLRARFRAA